MTVKNVDKWLRAGKLGKHLDRGSKESMRGLMLDIRGPRAASWTLRYQLNNGPTRHMGLGSAFEFTLAEARERARRERQRLRDKIDPLTVRRQEQAAALAVQARRMTFAEAAKHWFDAMRSGWSSVKSASNVLDAINKWAIPVIGKVDVGEIETKEVLAVLQQPVEDETLWTAYPPTASKLRNNIKLILDWSVVAEHRTRGPNPAEWKGHLSMVLPAPSAVAPTVNRPALDYRKVPELMAQLATREGIGALALRFTILTACRIGEAIGARWSEVNLDEGIWTVPRERMRARKEWRQPLAPQVIKLLRELPVEVGNSHVFVGEGQGEGASESAVRMLLRRIGYTDVVTHGFRSSFSTWAHEHTAHSNHAIELSLAHTIGTPVERAYRRGDMFEKRRRLMDDWARYVTTPPAAEKVGDTVVPIGSRR
jgi:integrase